MKKILYLTAATIAFTTAGCIVPAHEHGERHEHVRYEEHREVIVEHPTVVVRPPEVIVR